MENLRNAFLNPAAEFGPIPFWFWNDDLEHQEIQRQIHAFLEKGIPGFVIHPRKASPKHIAICLKTLWIPSHLRWKKLKSSVCSYFCTTRLCTPPVLPAVW